MLNTTTLMDKTVLQSHYIKQPLGKQYIIHAQIRILNSRVLTDTLFLVLDTRPV